ncbi:hypothetical protein PR048_026397 [Dryococelus australis]|uniref:Uncharacterized protein n=1 Tax=Dryococelus australis TaxID=614101 RepID=A0ABQ9GL67_9NEOP|nr:hypothetical protein PR048_026397 [Dryococelus australis]
MRCSKKDSEVLSYGEAFHGENGAAPESKGRGKREIPEKTRPAASSITSPTCENLGVTRLGIESGLHWWETIKGGMRSGIERAICSTRQPRRYGQRSTPPPFFFPPFNKSKKGKLLALVYVRHETLNLDIHHAVFSPEPYPLRPSTASATPTKPVALSSPFGATANQSWWGLVGREIWTPGAWPTDALFSSPALLGNPQRSTMRLRRCALVGRVREGGGGSDVESRASVREGRRKSLKHRNLSSATSHHFFVSFLDWNCRPTPTPPPLFPGTSVHDWKITSSFSFRFYVRKFGVICPLCCGEDGNFLQRFLSLLPARHRFVSNEFIKTSCQLYSGNHEHKDSPRVHTVGTYQATPGSSVLTRDRDVLGARRGMEREISPTNCSGWYTHPMFSYWATSAGVTAKMDTARGNAGVLYRRVILQSSPGSQCGKMGSLLFPATKCLVYSVLASGIFCRLAWLVSIDKPPPEHVKTPIARVHSDVVVTPRRIGFDSRRGRSWIFACGNRDGRRRWSTDFPGDLPFTLPLHSGAAPYSPRFTLIGSQDLAF